jgi:hypothetical protein
VSGRWWEAVFDVGGIIEKAKKKKKGKKKKKSSSDKRFPASPAFLNSIKPSS